MDDLSIFYIGIVVFVFIIGMANIIISIIRYRKKNIDDYLNGKELRKTKFLNGQE